MAPPAVASPARAACCSINCSCRLALPYRCCCRHRRLTPPSPAPVRPHPRPPSSPAAFLVVADEQFGRQIPFAFLEKVKEEWQQKWAEKGPTAAAHSLDMSFGPRLKHWMEYCEQHPEELSKVASVQRKVRRRQQLWRRRSRVGRLAREARGGSGLAHGAVMSTGQPLRALHRAGPQCPVASHAPVSASLPTPLPTALPCCPRCPPPAPLPLLLACLPTLYCLPAVYCCLPSG